MYLSILKGTFKYSSFMFKNNYYSTNNYFMLILNILFFLFASVLIIFLAYLTTKYISTRFGTGYNAKNIKLIEKLNIGADKSLVLIKLDNNYYLLFVSKNSVEVIDKLESLNISEISLDNNKFNDILSRFVKKK